MSIGVLRHSLALDVTVTGGVTTAAFLAFFPHRSDYAGHYVAGFAATLLMLLAYRASGRRSSDEAVVLLTLVAIALGALTETTIFRIAIFDPVDFFDQSMGAVVAALVFMGRRFSKRQAMLVAVIATVFLGFGFILAFT